MCVYVHFCMCAHRCMQVYESPRSWSSWHVPCGNQGCEVACLPLQLASKMHSILNLKISIFEIYYKCIEFILKHYTKSTLHSNYLHIFWIFRIIFDHLVKVRNSIFYCI